MQFLGERNISVATETCWADNYIEKRYSAEQAISQIKHGKRIFIGSSCGEPQYLVKKLTEASKHFTDLEIVRLLSLESTPLTLIADESKGQSFNIRSFYLGSAKPKSGSRESTCRIRIRHDGND